MANIKMFEALGEWTWLPSLYDEESLAVTAQTATDMTWEDADGRKIVMVGTGFSFDGTQSTGKVTGVTFLDESGVKLIEVSAGKYKLADLNETFLDKDVFNLFTALRAGNDTVKGSGLGDDILVGNDGGNDKVLGGDGDDYIKGHAGNNTYNGEGGWDMLSYDETIWDKANAKKGLVLNVADGVAKNPWGGTDKFESFESYLGSHRADKITGSKGDDRLYGMGGNDTINGGKGGRDTVGYDQEERYDGSQGGIVANLTTGKIKDTFGGTDTVSNIERVAGTSRDDAFVGSSKGDEFFDGKDGVDSYDGKGGIDALWFSAFGHPDHAVNVDLTLASGQIIDDGYGNTETATNMEAVSGTDYNDIIKLGSANAWAWAGDGDDLITSGTGMERLEGGIGADTFIFLTAAGIGAPTGDGDYLADFSQGEGDLIDLSAVASFIFIGTAAFSGASGELRFAQQGENTIVYGDTDGDGNANFALTIAGEVDLVESDFIV